MIAKQSTLSIGSIFAATSVEQAAEFLLSENLFTRYRARGRFYQSLGLGIVAKLNWNGV